MTNKASEIEIEKILDKIELTKDGDGYHKLKEYWIRFDGKELGGGENKHGLVKAITDKFYIIPKNSPPDKHVKIINMNLKLKWREEEK